jgi:cobalt-zinc-cadmium efflux system protein
VAGVVGHSVALLADAGHNLSDVLSLLLAWGASRLAAQPPSARFTYGMKSSSILAALANAALLWVALGAILIETLRSLVQPEAVHAPLVIGVAAAGIAVNGLSAVLFAKGSKDDINLRAAFQHLLADAVVSAGVVVAGFAVMLTGWNWIDPVTSIIITAMIGLGSWSLLRDRCAWGCWPCPRASMRPRSAPSWVRTPGQRRPRPAHLADEHDRNRADRASGDSRRASGRRFSP